MKFIQELLNESANVNQLTGYKVAELKKAFKEINRIAFNNELPDVAIKVNTHKTLLGMFKYLTEQTGGVVQKVKPVSLSISKFLEFDAAVVYSILAHEMVHLKIAMDAIDANIKVTELNKQQDHGAYFKAEAKRVSLKLGITVPVSEMAKKRNVADNGKPINVLVINNVMGDASTMMVSIVTPGVLRDAQTQNNLNFLKQIAERLKAKSVIIGTLSGHAELSRQKTNRKISGKDFKWISKFPLNDVKVIKKFDV